MLKIKSKLLILTLIIISSNISKAPMTSGYYVVPNPSLSEEIMTRIENKVKVSLTKAGVTAVDGAFPLVTVVSYDEGETIEVEGIRRVYQANGTLNIMVLFDGYNSILASRSFDIQGTAFSKDIAYKNAIKNTDISPNEVRKLMLEAKNKYDEVLEPWCESVIRKARDLVTKGYDDDAISLVSKIPMDSKYYNDALSIIGDVLQSRENARLEKLAQEQAEQERAERQEERQYNLIETYIKEYYSTEREKWASQRSPDVYNYYDILYKQSINF